MKKFIWVFGTLLSVNSLAQKIPVATPAEKRMEVITKREHCEKKSLVKNIRFESIGPTIMSGRVTDVDADPENPEHFYVAYASGGLFETKNNGQSFTPLFDNEAVITMGDIAVDWKHGQTIWIGTGENNSSRSSYAGCGIYKSTDSGKTWQYKGLPESHHTGRIIISPENPDIVYVAVIGHLYSANEERGVYKTTDGGNTWSKILYIDSNTGAIDISMDPKNSKILYAAMWYRVRRAWNITESGSTSGIYKTTDEGNTWNLLTTKESGFPTGNGVGRIGLCIAGKNPDLLYAVVDNQNLRDEKKVSKKIISKDSLRTMTKEIFLALSDSVVTPFLKKYDFTDYSLERIRIMVKSDSIKPSALADYVEDSNAALFDKQVTGAEVYRSTNGGKTWRRTHTDYIDDFFHSYGYYFGQIRLAPDDEGKIYLAGVSLITSTDSGKTFSSIDAENMHGDYHGIWINPYNSKHLIIGNDGGINITYDDGKNYIKANTPAVGQFYSVNVDNDTPYNVYGGLQDNGVWTGSSDYKFSTAWHQDGQYPYKSIMGGDGMQVMVDTRDNKTIYTGFQFGYYYRLNKITGSATSIKPHHKLGERPLRFNWQTPIWLSKHNQDIIYLGSNKFHRSMNRGDDFLTLTGDMTKGGKKGDVAYGTITTIHESPLKFGLIYIATDDGLAYISKDAGYTWKRISDPLPEIGEENTGLSASRIIASAFDTGRVYITRNGYRNDDFNSYIYVSENYGATWQQIGMDLPPEPVNVLREDPSNKNILYVGTDNGLYISIDRGKNFMRCSNNLPNVAVHDLVIQAREHDIVLGTHGRSLYKSSVKELQLLNDSILQKPVYLFDPDPVTWNLQWGKKEGTWGKIKEAFVTVPYFSKGNNIVQLTLYTADSTMINQVLDTAETGINYANLWLTIDTVKADSYYKKISAKKDFDKDETPFDKSDDGKYYLLPATYLVRAESGGNSVQKKFEIKKRKKKKETGSEAGIE